MMIYKRHKYTYKLILIICIAKLENAQNFVDTINNLFYTYQRERERKSRETARQ